jgi:hypothetical protein
MNVLVACEFSGAVRRAFQKRGHNAWSCDLLPAEDGSPYHLQSDVREWVDRRWDLIIAFPPCTHLCGSGARWWKERQDEQQEAADFFMFFTALPFSRIAIENPVGIMSRWFCRPSQIVQPWWFGHGETKATCLWLKGLPLLQPVDVVEGRLARVHRMSPGRLRSRERSRTYAGMADAMAAQWGC